MRIWLDDIRPAPEGWVWVKNSYQFGYTVCNVSFSDIEAISFDNDLGEGEREGWEIAKDLLAFYLDQGITHVPMLTCHSANVAARPRIEGYFNDIRRLCNGVL